MSCRYAVVAACESFLSDCSVSVLGCMVEVTTLDARCQLCAQEMRSEIVLVMTCCYSHLLWVIHRQLLIFECQAGPELDPVEIDLDRRPTAAQDA
jgi:hypothetical protein